MNYLMQTEAKCGVGTEVDAQKFLRDLAVAAKPVAFAIYKIVSVGDVRTLHVVFMCNSGGYVEDHFGNMMFNFDGGQNDGKSKSL